MWSDIWATGQSCPTSVDSDDRTLNALGLICVVSSQSLARRLPARGLSGYHTPPIQH